MSKTGVQGRDAFRDRVSRISAGAETTAGGGMRPSGGGIESPVQAAGETPQDLRERIQATLATDMSASRTATAGSGRRMIGLPLVIGTLGLLAVMLVLRHPVDDLSSVVGPRANGIFPSFPENSPRSTGYAGSKTITVAPSSDR